jgi:hypothetical protein
LIVGGGSTGHPPAGLSCFAGLDADEGTSLMMPRHRLKNIINNKEEQISNNQNPNHNFVKSTKCNPRLPVEQSHLVRANEASPDDS